MRCAFCHDDLDGPAARSCTSCGTRLHSECWNLARRGCPTLGCAGRTRPLRPRRRRRPRGRRGQLSGSFVPVGLAIGVSTAVPAGLSAALWAVVEGLYDNPSVSAVSAFTVAVLAVHFLIAPALWLTHELGCLRRTPAGWRARFWQALGMQTAAVTALGLVEAGFVFALHGLGFELAGLTAFFLALSLPAAAGFVAATLQTSSAPRARARPRVAPVDVVVANLPIVIRARPEPSPIVFADLAVAA